MLRLYQYTPPLPTLDFPDIEEIDYSPYIVRTVEYETIAGDPEVLQNLYETISGRVKPLGPDYIDMSGGTNTLFV